jgi:hypothetical protein
MSGKDKTDQEDYLDLYIKPPEDMTPEEEARLDYLNETFFESPTEHTQEEPPTAFAESHKTSPPERNELPFSKKRELDRLVKRKATLDEVLYWAEKRVLDPTEIGLWYLHDKMVRGEYLRLEEKNCIWEGWGGGAEGDDVLADFLEMCREDRMDAIEGKSWFTKWRERRRQERPRATERRERRFRSLASHYQNLAPEGKSALHDQAANILENIGVDKKKIENWRNVIEPKRRLSPFAEQARRLQQLNNDLYKAIQEHPDQETSLQHMYREERRKILEEDAPPNR